MSFAKLRGAEAADAESKQSVARLWRVQPRLSKRL